MINVILIQSVLTFLAILCLLIGKRIVLKQNKE
jgi:hypothetical protein